ncbi:MAG: YfhO family protein [Chloroflexota bacterium]
MSMRRLVSRLRWPHLVLIAPFLLLAPVLFTGRALFWGTPALQFLPWRAWAWETLRGGHLPLWNPLLGMGAPLFANYQVALLYPPNWLYFLLATVGGISAMAWGQALLVAFHLAWAGWGMLCLARALGLNELAQSVSGLAFGLSGYLVARAGFLSINATVAWVPWIMLFSMELVRQERGWASAWKLSGAMALLLLAGHAQVAWYTLLLMVVWLGYWGFYAHSQYKKKDSKWWKKLILKLGLIFVFALGISALQLLPTIEYLLLSQRSQAVDIHAAMTYSLWPWHLITLIAPGFFGNPEQGDYWGYANYWEGSLYIGWLPFILAMWALIKGGRLTRFLAASALFSFVLALGDNTPIFPWLYRNIPTFDLFQAPARWTICGVWALSLLAGFAADNWQRPVGRSLYWTRLATVGGFAVMLGAALTYLLLPEVKSTFIPATALVGLWGMGTGVLALTVPKPGQTGKLWGWGVTLWVMVDLLVAGWGLNPVIEADFYRQPSPSAAQVRELVGEGRLYLPTKEEDSLKYDRFFRFDTFDTVEDWTALRATLLPNLNLLDGIPSANNYDPLLPERYARWMDQLSVVEVGSQEYMLGLMGVSVVERLDSSYPAGVRFESLSGGKRWRWAICAHPAQDADDAWVQVVEEKKSVGDWVVLEGIEQAGIPGCASQGDTYIETIALQPDRLEFVLEAPSSGWLVISDVWYPGWQAQVDRRAVPILRADYLFRAVEVPVGEHTIILVYKPSWLFVGMVVSVLALCVWAGLWVVLRRLNPMDKSGVRMLVVCRGEGVEDGIF